jgi:hypothetical protein
MKLNRVRWAAGLAFLTLSAGVVPLAHNGVAPQAQAQNIGQRAVTGTVMNAESTPVTGATVFLRNAKTKSIRSYTTAQDGRFRFTQVNRAEDYDLWAEKDGKKSVTKSVSSWDARKEFETELRIK